MHRNSKIKSLRRRSFLLMEVLTSCFIAGLIIASCITLLTVFITKRGSEQSALVASQKRWQSASYLRWVLMNIVSERNNNPLFVVDEGPSGAQRLIFHLNHGIDSSPNDSSVMLAMLYLDKEKGLMLVHRPLKSRKDFGFEEEKAYSIWPGAKEVKWHFFVKNELVQDSSQPNRADWKDTWPKEENGLPLAIKAEIEEQGDGKNPIKVEVTGIVLGQMKEAIIHTR